MEILLGVVLWIISLLSRASRYILIQVSSSLLVRYKSVDIGYKNTGYKNITVIIGNRSYIPYVILTGYRNIFSTLDDVLITGFHCFLGAQKFETPPLRCNTKIILHAQNFGALISNSGLNLG